MSAITHYNSSKGPRVIADMPFPHLANAIMKLADLDDPERAAELTAMRENLAERQEAYEAKQALEAGRTFDS
jgi:hypothetical protein